MTYLSMLLFVLTLLALVITLVTTLVMNPSMAFVAIAIICLIASILKGR